MKVFSVEPSATSTCGGEILTVTGLWFQPDYLDVSGNPVAGTKIMIGYENAEVEAKIVEYVSSRELKVAAPALPELDDQAKYYIKAVNPDQNDVLEDSIRFVADKYGYVANNGANTLTIFDVSDGSIVNTVNTDPRPYGVAAASDGSVVLVTTTGYDNVMVFDAAKLIDDPGSALITSVDVGTDPVDIRISADSDYALVMNSYSKDVSVIDLSDYQVSDPINVNGSAQVGRFSKDGLYAFVSIWASPGRVAVIKFDPDVIFQNPQSAYLGYMTVCNSPIELEVGPNPEDLYVTSYTTNEVTRVTIQSLEPTISYTTKAIDVGSHSCGIGISGSGSHVFASGSDQDINVIKTADNSVLPDTIAVDQPAISDLEVSIDDNYIFTVNNAQGSVSQFSAPLALLDPDMAHIRDIVVGSRPWVMAMQSSVGCVNACPRPMAFVSNQNDDTLSVVDTTLGLELSAVSVGDHPIGVAISDDGNTLLVTNMGDDTVSFLEVDKIISDPDNAVNGTVPVGLNPVDVRITPDGDFALVVNTTSENISVIDIPSKTVIEEFGVPGSPQVMRIRSDGERAYMTSLGSPGQVVIIDLVQATDGDPATDPVIGTTPLLGNTPIELEFGPHGSDLYVTDAVINYVSHLIPVKHIPDFFTRSDIGLPTASNGIGITSTGDHVIIGGVDGNIYLIRSSDDLVINYSDPIDVEFGTISDIEITCDDRSIFTVNRNNNSITKVDFGKALFDPVHSIEGTYSVGTNPIVLDLENICQ